MRDKYCAAKKKTACFCKSQIVTISFSVGKMNLVKASVLQRLENGIDLLMLW